MDDHRVAYFLDGEDWLLPQYCYKNIIFLTYITLYNSIDDIYNAKF